MANTDYVNKSVGFYGVHDFNFTNKPGKSLKKFFNLEGASPIFRSCRAHQSIKPNFANSDGCKVKPAISIQFLFPLMFFPRFGINGSSKIMIEILSE